MNIKWNEVTWYSKLLAAIFLLGFFPAWAFYLGMQYETIISEGDMLAQNPIVSFAALHATDARVPASWKKYTNTDLGIQFDYPAYFGDASIAKNNESCPEMKTYASAGMLDTTDYSIHFSLNPSENIFATTSLSFGVIQKKAAGADICGDAIADLEQEVSTAAAPFKQSNLIEAYSYPLDYANEINSGPIAQFYTLFHTENGTVTILQPRVDFEPDYTSQYWSKESAEIQGNSIKLAQNPAYPDVIAILKAGHHWSDITPYFEDLNKVVNSIEFISRKP